MIPIIEERWSGNHSERAPKSMASLVVLQNFRHDQVPLRIGLLVINLYASLITARYSRAKKTLERIRQDTIAKNGNDFWFRQEFLCDWVRLQALILRSTQTDGRKRTDWHTPIQTADYLKSIPFGDPACQTQQLWYFSSII